jgi:hypothetical protein
MSQLTASEERALNVIKVRGLFLCEVSVSDWFQTSEKPFEMDPDGFPVEAAVAEALIKRGYLLRLENMTGGSPPATGCSES